MVEYLPTQQEALSSNSSTTKTKQKLGKQRKKCMIFNNKKLEQNS
jgi:hypothetical protein